MNLPPSPSPPNERQEDEIYELWRKEPPGPDKEKLLSQLISLLRKHAFAVAWLKLHDSRPDIVNDAVHRALSNLESFRGESKFSTWFQSIVSNLCMTEGRSIAREPLKVVIDDESFTTKDSTESKIELDEIRERLDPESQQLIDLKLTGLTEDEIAERLGISRKNVCWRWSELKKRILRDAGGKRA